MPATAAPVRQSDASVQFLNTVLSQRGPSALPYTEDVKWSIRQHLISAIQEFPGLSLKTGSFTHNDGRAANLLKMDGTIPMFYQGFKYNIPVTIWLLESYPRTCPLVFVTPTRDMIIKPRHAFVDASGMVSAPYLREWVYPRSNLVELCQTLSVLFGQDPPLYARPPTVPARAPPPQQHAFTATNPMHSSGPGRGASTSTPSPPPVRPIQTISPSPAPLSSLGARPLSQSGQTWTDNPGEVFKRNAINTLTDKLRQDIATFNREVTADMDSLFTTQVLLNQRAETLEKGVQELTQEKEALEQSLQLCLTNTDVVDSWLKANDKGAGGGGQAEVDIDKVFETADVFSKQLLEASAEDLAIEDVLYALDKAVQEGAIEPETYLKSTRNLSREQFFHRATCLKVRAAQQQAQALAYSRTTYR